MTAFGITPNNSSNALINNCTFTQGVQITGGASTFSGCIFYGTSGTSNTITFPSSGFINIDGSDSTIYEKIERIIKLAASVREVKMPDGSVLNIDEHGNYRIEDKNSKITYKANNRREFNPYVNAGDLLAKFVDYVRTSVPGVRRLDISKLPIQLFVEWLIYEAAVRDDDPVPEDIMLLPKSRLLTSKIRPQCRLSRCRRFIKKSFVLKGFEYCNLEHAGLALEAA